MDALSQSLSIRQNRNASPTPTNSLSGDNFPGCLEQVFATVVCYLGLPRGPSVTCGWGKLSTGDGASHASVETQFRARGNHILAPGARRAQDSAFTHLYPHPLHGELWVCRPSLDARGPPT